MQKTVYLGLGSNRENRLWFIFQTLRSFIQTPFMNIQKVSSIYETEPYGIKNQRDFLNVVVEIQTSFTPGKLLQCIKFIEKKVGRIERGFWAPREIDIDILAFGDKVIQLPWLTIPHHEVHKRRFVLSPFAEISPNIILPKHEKTVRALLEDCSDHSRVDAIIPREAVEEQLVYVVSQEMVFI